MNKRELELKDIVCYLPYGLKCSTNEFGVKTVASLCNGCIGYEFMGCMHWYELSNTHPILRPMIDLTKEIVVDGYNDDKPFIPAEVVFLGNVAIEDGEIYLKTTTFGGHIAKHMFTVDAMLMNYKQIELLNQWHFDYKGLINEGLAIDINMINK